MADSLEDLLHFDHETMVIDRFSQFYDTEMTRAFINTFFALFAFVGSIDRTKMRIVWTLGASSNSLFITSEKSEKSFSPGIYQNLRTAPRDIQCR